MPNIFNRALPFLVLPLLMLLPASGSKAAGPGPCDQNAPACIAAINSLDSFDAENAGLPDGGATRSTVAANCKQQYVSVIKAIHELYVEEWQALYNKNKSKGMTVKQAKLQVLNQHPSFELIVSRATLSYVNCLRRLPVKLGTGTN